MLTKIFSKVSGKPEQAVLTAALRKAALKGNLARVQRLAARGAQIDAKDAKGLTAVYDAAAGGHHGTARWLLEQGANANAGQSHDTTGTALTAAARNGDVEMLKLLVAHKADIDGWTYTRSALHEAIWHGHTAAAAWLLEQGALVDSLDRMKFTPLMEAVFGDHRELSRLLARRGADMSVRTVQGETMEAKIKSKGWDDVLAAAEAYKADVIARRRADKAAVAAAMDDWERSLDEAAILKRDMAVRAPLKIRPLRRA
jgi:ankyrin repeat protein